MLGLCINFITIIRGKVNLENRYFKISERIYNELDERLSQSSFLADKDYTIADIVTFPWIARHDNTISD